MIAPSTAVRGNRILERLATIPGARIACGKGFARAPALQPTDAHPGDTLLVEQVDRLSRLTAEDWERLKSEMTARRVRVVALDLPKFGAMRIRIALDDRDGFTERKREAAYNLLCQLGTHPTYTGFQMLHAKGSDKVIVGPFFEGASLDAVLSELAKTILQAGAQTRHAGKLGSADYRMSLDYLTTQADWSDRFFGSVVDRTKLTAECH